MAINVAKEKSSPFALTRIIGFVRRERHLHFWSWSKRPASIKNVN